MASKHDGKHARANMWVTHDNLARAKGGRPHYQFKERKRSVLPKSLPPSAVQAAPSAETAPAEAAGAIVETPATTTATGEANGSA